MAGLLFLMKTYAEKLRDPRWQRKRLEIMSRDNFACCNCKDETITLNVHHIKYIQGRDPWDYDADNFETLCEECHKARHDKSEDVEIELFRMAILSSVRSRKFVGYLAVLARMYQWMEKKQNDWDSDEGNEAWNNFHGWLPKTKTAREIVRAMIYTIDEIEGLDSYADNSITNNDNATSQ